jgi:hypothetical protein
MYTRSYGACMALAFDPIVYDIKFSTIVILSTCVYTPVGRKFSTSVDALTRNGLELLQVLNTQGNVFTQGHIGATQSWRHISTGSCFGRVSTDKKIFKASAAQSVSNEDGAVQFDTVSPVVSPAVADQVPRVQHDEEEQVDDHQYRARRALPDEPALVLLRPDQDLPWGVGRASLSTDCDTCHPWQSVACVTS